MNVWTDPNQAFSQLGSHSGIILVLLDCPSRSGSQMRAGVARNWRLLKAFALASATPVIEIGRMHRTAFLTNVIASIEGAAWNHIVIAGNARGGSMLPIFLEVALLGLQASIVHDAFIEGRYTRSCVMPNVLRRPWQNAPVYVSTSQVLANILTRRDVDEHAS